MTAGKRNKFVTITRQPEASDFSDMARPAERVHQCWALVRPANGHEIESARAMEAKVSHMVEIDFPFKTIKASDTVKFTDGFHRARTLNVTAVMNPDEADKELRLTCVEVLQ